MIEYGPRWNNLKQVQWTFNQGLALLELPGVFDADINSYGLHPALLDRATGFLSSQQQPAEHYLPFSYKKIKIKGSLPKVIFSHSRQVQFDQTQKETLQFDMTIMDDQGTEIVEIEGYTRRRVDVDKLPVLSAKPQRSTNASSLGHQNRYVELMTPGQFETFTLKSIERRQPGPGELEIEVHAAGLNFKEVLLALGMLPSPPDGPIRFGLECAGRVVALGQDVEDFEIGDEVMGFASSCFSSYVVTPASKVAHKPENLSFEEAATIPVAFLTAYYALMTQGRLCQDERVLIHAAAGGVGLAAVNIAQWVGADIFATAGTPEKRRFLRSLGIDYVMDSRSLSFADEVMDHSRGKGVDVVLNSLSGEFIPTSLRTLAPYGRFLELGIRDIASNHQLGLRPFEKSLTFCAIMAGPSLPNFTTIWQDVIEHVQAGHFRPLPIRIWPLAQVSQAFEYMAEAKHIGKIVISLRAASSPPKTVPSLDNKRLLPTPVGLGTSLKSGLRPTEGVEVFSRILGSNRPQVIVSTQDLARQIKHDKTLRMTRFQDMFEQTTASQVMYARPKLSTTYVAPSNEIEQMLVVLYQQLLGIEQVGIHDNFFDLGGHSLLAIQLLSRIREALRVELPLSSIFEQPTVAELTLSIRQQYEQLENNDIDGIQSVTRGREAELLGKLDQLSDELVDTLLQQEFSEDEVDE